MMFFSHKIKFKKQSESLGLNLNDKYIKKSKQQLIQLTQKHQRVDESLKKKKNEFETEKNKLISEHQFLIKQEKRHKLKILKLQVRKDQLMSKKTPQITHKKAQILKRYLKCMAYTIGDKYELIKSMGNYTTYDFIKTKILNLEQKIYFKAKMKEVVFMKKLDFEDEKIMLIIKEKDSVSLKSNRQHEASSNKSKTVKSILNPSKFNPVSEGQLTMKKSYQVKIFAVTGEPFEFVKVYEERQLSGFIEKLSNEKKALMFDTFTTLKNPMTDNRKPRLSLQFNSVFKKSLQGFFFKRTSLTTNELQNKLVNIEQWIKQSKNGEKNHGDSDNSKTEQNRSICQSSEDRQDMNSSARSKASDASCSKQSQANFNNQKQNIDNKLNFPRNLFATFHDQKSNETNKTNANKAVEFNTNNVSSNNEDSELSNNNSSKLNSFSTVSGFVRSFIYGEKILFPDVNPLLNIVILKKKNTLFFLPEYLQKKQNFNLINFCVKKYQLKIKLQKQVRRSLLYKIIKLDNFFETENGSVQPFSLELLFSVKYAKNDIYVPKINEIKENLKLGRQLQSHANFKDKNSGSCQLRGKDMRGYNEEDIVITCENIRCQSEQKTFLIHHILKEQMFNDLNSRMFNMLNGVNTGNTRIKGRAQNLDIKRKKNELKIEDLEKSKDERRKLKKKKLSKNIVNKTQEMKEEQDRKQLFFRDQIQNMFEGFIQTNWLSIKEYRFMKKISFEEHLDKIIVIQKNMKCFYYRKLYKKKQKNSFVFKFEPSTKILITAMLDNKSQQIKIFTECLLLRLNQKYKSYPVLYAEKYWTTICSALNNLMRLSDSIVEIKDELEKYFHKKIKIYEQQQARLEALKPQLYLNRLRRFFINIMLRVKTKQNIIYLKKLYHNSQAYVLMIRKSPILKNVCQANLYHLQEFIQKEQNKENLNQIEHDESWIEAMDLKTGKTLQNNNEKNHSKRHKSRYQTISLLVDYFTNIPKDKIADEFYFDSKHFLLKPPKNPSIYYIERLLMIDINSEQIAKEVAMIQWQQPSKKKKNFDRNSFLNCDPSQRNNQISAIMRLSQGKSSKQSQRNQQTNFRVKRKNASIMLHDPILQIHNKLVLPNNDKNHRSRRSFRVSQRSNCKVFEDNGNKNRHHSKLLLSKNEMPLMVQQESSNKLSSGNRLSKSSLYDIFNNSYNNKKVEYQIRDNGHGKLLYYSLAKVEEVFYELHVYTIKRKFIVKKITNQQASTKIQTKNTNDQQNQVLSKAQNTKNMMRNKIKYNCEEETVVSEEQNYIRKNAFSDELFLVYRENLTKKELLQANWAFVYNKIARWIKNNQNLLLLVDENPNKI